MNLLKPSKVEIPDKNPGDQRIGHLLQQHADNPKAVLIGFPSDEGVQRNGGRTGAAKAPAEIREMLYKMTTNSQNEQKFISLLEHTNDLGNINISDDLEADQEILGKTGAEFLKKGVLPVILGGGHETAFGHFLGYAKAELPTSIFNLDAHTDVRLLKNGKAHSGSPFRQAIEHKSNCCEKYVVAGLQPHAVAKSHLQYIDEHKGHYHFKDETDITTIQGLFDLHQSKNLMVTFDMDAVDQAFAPGVSAPCTNGLQPNLWLKAAYLAGQNKQITSFDISEMNPKYDRDGQTAGLAALTIWQFLRGVSER